MDALATSFSVGLLGELQWADNEGAGFPSLPAHAILNRIGGDKDIVVLSLSESSKVELCYPTLGIVGQHVHTREFAEVAASQGNTFDTQQNRMVVCRVK